MKKLFKNAVQLFFLLAGILLFAGEGNSAALKHFDKGLSYQNRENWYEAAEEFQQAVQANNSFGEAWYHLARVTYEVNDFNLCLTYLESAEKFCKNRTDILNLRGMCYISLRRLDDAKVIFQNIIKEYPNNVDARFGLAEIELYSGGFDGAENFYLDALKRQGTNRKALLSLALLCAETGKNDMAQKYILQALKYHSADAEVHYLAGFLEAKKGNLREAERRARAAVQIKNNYTNAYILLASILYAQKNYDEVIDICDYLINTNRNTIKAWFLKGYSQYKKNLPDDAFDTWSQALSIDETDEILRSALEMTVTSNMPLEDERRSELALWHIKKAREYTKLFQGEEARYEYQRALKLDPSNYSARSEFAELIRKIGLNELYLNQLNFINDNSKIDVSGLTEQERYNYIKTKDTIEAYNSLMKYSLNNKWNVEPFYLDKTRWNMGIYFTKSPVQLNHVDSEDIAAFMAQESFSGAAVTSVSVQKTPVSGYGEAFRMARNSKQDYFVLMKFEESEREVSLDAVIYNGRNGTETSKFSLFRTGNDRFASVLRSFRRNVLNILPARGKIIARSGNDILVDMGKSEGITKGTVLDVVKAGNVRTVDKGPGVTFDEKYSLGQILIEQVGEEISQGTLTQKSFYDRVNLNDELLVKSIPASAEAGGIADTNPAADQNGNLLPTYGRTEKLTAEDLGLVKTPLFVDLIRSID